MLKHSELVEFLKGTQPIADDQTAAKAVFLYPEWKSGIEITQEMIDVGMNRYVCDGELYKCIKAHTTQDNWRPGQVTASIWTVIDVTHAGTLADPIPFALNMEVYKDKYYTWADVLYLCTRDSGIALQNSPDQLIGHYFTEA